MADLADLASDRMEQQLQDRIATRVRYQGVSLTHCESCDEEIPEGRRNAIPGVRLCVFCQEAAERSR